MLRFIIFNFILQAACASLLQSVLTLHPEQRATVAERITSGNSAMMNFALQSMAISTRKLNGLI